MGDGLEADKGPGRQRRHMENLERHGLVDGKRRGEGVPYSRMRPEGRAENDQDAEEQQERENRLRVRGEPFASDYQRAEQDNGGVGKQDLAEPDVIAGYAVMEAELEYAAEEISHNQ